MTQNSAKDLEQIRSLKGKALWTLVDVRLLTGFEAFGYFALSLRGVMLQSAASVKLTCTLQNTQGNARQSVRLLWNESGGPSSKTGGQRKRMLATAHPLNSPFSQSNA